MPKCIFCGTELVNESPEHVLLNAFGGRMTTTQVICTKCNHSFGEEMDKSFAEDFDVLRNALNCPCGDGSPPPTIRKIVRPDGTEIDLLPGFRPQSRSVVYLRTPSGDRTDLKIGVATLERLANHAGQFAKGVSLTRDAFVEALKKAQVTIRSEVIKDLPRFEFRVGGHAQTRSVTKSALILWAIRTSNLEVASGHFDRAIAFVKATQTGEQNVPADWIARFNFSPHPVLSNDPTFGPEQLPHSIAVWSDEAGRVVGFYQLFGNIGYSIRLATSGGTPNVGIILQQNPITGEWNRRNLADGDLPACSTVEELAITNQDYEQIRLRISTAIQQKLDTEANKSMISESLDLAMKNPSGEFNSHAANIAAQEISERLVQLLYGGKREQSRSGQEIAHELNKLLDNQEQQSL